MIELLNIKKRYGAVEAVSGISLVVEKGEFVTLLGPSGSGKSTTLMMVAGHEHPDSGAILIAGNDVTNLPAHKRGIGMVFQHFALFPHLTVEQNIAFPLKMRNLSRDEIEGKVKSSLDLVRLQGLGSRLPRQLSGGQQQRVALARALVFDPSVLLMDEPLSSLDKNLRDEMQLEIKRLQRRLGVTTLYVTHDQKEALVISDRVVVFNAGAIEQAGTPDELYEHPRNTFVADFIGESNILTGRMTKVNGRYCQLITSEGLSLQAPALGEMSSGEQIIVAVRPESISIGGSPPGDNFNQVTGTVEEITYYGEGFRVSVSIGGDNLIVAKQENTGLQKPLNLGQKVCLFWRRSKTNIFKQERINQ